MADRSSKKRTALLAVVFCVVGALLVSLPALGLRLTPQADSGDSRFDSGTTRQDPAFITRVKISGRVEEALSPGVASPSS